MLAERSMVVLKSDLPDIGLSVSDVGEVAFIHNSGAAFEVEFVDGDGRTISLVTLEASQVQPLAGGELLHARKRD